MFKKLQIVNLSFLFPGIASLNINQLHFIKSSEVPYLFIVTFSAHFIAESHFVAMCTCSEACVLHTNNCTMPTPHLHHKLAILIDNDNASA